MTRKTMVHRLSCGMPLLMFPIDEVAVATVDVWVRTGASDEPPEVAGISHFLEHMLFKGTKKYGLGEIERIIESVGGVSNAGTSHDFTHYYITIPTTAIDTAIDMLAEMVCHSVIDKTELEKERLVILEEYRRKQDFPPGVLYERLYAELFESGPYHDPVIGTEQTIRAITRDQMDEYYGNRYGPTGMALVVAGAFEPEGVIKLAERSFEGFDRPLVALRPERPLRFGRDKRIHKTMPTGGEVYVAWGFPAAGMNRQNDVLPLDTAQTVLGQGRAAILYQRLKEKRGLCSSISAFYPTHAGDSLFAFGATCLPEQREALRTGLIEELTRFCESEPMEPVMNRAMRLQVSGHRFAMEKSGSVTSNVGYYYTLTGGTEFLDGYLDRMQRVTAGDVRGVAAATFRPPDLAGSLVEVAVGPNGAEAAR